MHWGVQLEEGHTDMCTVQVLALQGVGGCTKNNNT